MPVEPPPTPWDFPPPSRWGAEDLVAIGADLAPGTLLAAYRAGLFPMVVDEREAALGWWSPVRRGVLPLDGLRVSRSLRRSARDLEVRIDTAFHQVVAECADPRRPGSWITDPFRAAYGELHRLGWAHSVETWRDGELVGGLYGVAVGGLFAGESMFHRATDASKVALMGLVDVLADGRERLLDVQWRTDHLATLGVVEISRETYLQRLAEVLVEPLPEAFAGPRA
jgi:leucyl/phenylalanyl-tRNA--protein transferase